jgi:hypothetical protein
MMNFESLESGPRTQTDQCIGIHQMMHRASKSRLFVTFLGSILGVREARTALLQSMQLQKHIVYTKQDVLRMSLQL